MKKAAAKSDTPSDKTATESPRNLVASKCIAYTEALLNHRRSSLSNDDASRFGQELFAWFEVNNALTPENAPIALRSVDLGITLLKASHESAAEITGRIHSTYLDYAQ